MAQMIANAATLARARRNDRCIPSRRIRRRCIRTSRGNAPNRDKQR